MEDEDCRLNPFCIDIAQTWCKLLQKVRSGWKVLPSAQGKRGRPYWQ